LYHFTKALTERKVTQLIDSSTTQQLIMY